MSSSSKVIDQLTEDTPIPNQLWCCMSFLSPETLKNCSLRAIKIRGVYNTREEADKRAQFLQKVDPDFNIFVGEVGKWLGWDPDPNSAEDQVYREKKLQEIMTNYKKNREKSKVMEEERKREMLEESVRNEAAKTLSRAEKKKHALRRKQEQKRLDKQMATIEESRFKSGELPPESAQAVSVAKSEPTPEIINETIKQKEQMITAEKERISNNEQVIKKATYDAASLDSKLNKLQSHYYELIEKKKQKLATQAK
ncbi:MAG: hypothetical protein Hyperionvirus19_42 [Hyperionvirus sp.]|uniref:Uncharacterized protein n=1 Tax=Hyperionvirus sp. TaxID=2487770 RepID=A0A3G5AAE7_9VIRU|nr:MAG: hypothetical protein Hyperionvirus19_42 [Hyperionvirus sp.]